MYCTISDLQKILPYNVTIGDNNIGTPSPGQPVTKRSKLTPEEAMGYIRFAAQEIDSRLRPFYICPLRRVNSFETEIIENVNSGSQVKVRVWDSSVFAKGDVVRLQNKYEMESAVVYSFDPSDTRYVVIDKIMYGYPADESKITILKFPDPIPIICARFAASYAFDQLFNAEQAPEASNYGVEQRKLALNAMDSILSGTALLNGQDRSGRRFCRGEIMDNYNNPTADFQFGREKS